MTANLDAACLDQIFNDMRGKVRPLQIWADAFDIPVGAPELFTVNEAGKIITARVDLERLGRKYPTSASFYTSILMLEMARLCGLSVLNMIGSQILPEGVRKMFDMPPISQPLLKIPCPFTFTQAIMGGAIASRAKQLGHKVAPDENGYRFVIEFANAQAIAHLMSKMRSHSMDGQGQVTVDSRAVQDFQIANFARNFLQNQNA